MRFQYIIGGAGTGKTKYIYDSIIKQSIEDRQKTIIMLVPEQFTLQTQRDLVIKHPNSGIMKIEVLSFQRLAYRIFEEVGIPNKKTLGDMGKSMVLRKVVVEIKEQLTFFNKMIDKIGFIDELKLMITELYQYEIHADELKAYRDKIDDKPLLKDKITDLCNIYETFQDYINKHYITTEETLDLLKDRISKSDVIKDCCIWIDGFYGFTPQQYSVITQLAKVCEKICFSVTLDPNEDINQLDETDLFYESKKTINKLTKIAKENNIKILKPVRLEDKEYNIKVDNALVHLGKNIFRHPYKIYKEEANNIKIFTASNRLTEVEYISRKIKNLTKEKNYQYKQIAVLTGGISEYEKIIERIFNMYDIPFFIDKKKEIMSHPLVELIRAVLDIFNLRWSYESVFRYLKTNLIGINKDDVDQLENFVLEHGIRGITNWTKRDWFEEYKKNKSLSQFQEKRLFRINETRKKVIKPLISFQKKMKKCKPLKIKNVTTLLLDLLEELEIPTQIEQYINGFKTSSKLLLEREYKQIWKLLMDLFDKMVEVLGEHEVTISDYAKLLDAGIEQCKMGLVPPGLDQIVVGDLERSRLHNIRALFVIGLNDGIIPSKIDETGILTDEERNYLQRYGREMASGSKKKSFEEQFLIYTALTKPREILYISYALADQQGSALRPSILLSRIKRIIPNINEINEEKIDKDIQLIQEPYPTLCYLVPELRKYIQGAKINILWLDTYTWFYKNKEWKEKLITIVKGLYHENQEKYLNKETVKKLYKDTLYSSISKLENFASCPFSYFIKYGLNAKNRKIFEIQPPDVGMIFHLALEKFSSKLKDENLDWAEINEQKRTELVEKTLEDLPTLLNNSIFLSTNRNKYLAERLKRITKRAVSTLQEHIKKGDFIPKDFELSFGNEERLPAIKIEFEQGKQMNLTGKIDRVDLLEGQEQAYVKIIDYKSGNQTFDIVAVYHGLQLQLIVYLDAVLELGQEYYGKKLVPAGMFYFKIDDPIITSMQELSEEQLQEEILKKFKMSGLVLSDIEIIKKIDKSIERYSKILPVQLTKDGMSKLSSSASLKMFEALQKYVKAKVKELGEEILLGNVKINPYKKDKKTGCDYCSYSSICQFDTQLKNNRYNYLKNINKEEFWREICNGNQDEY